MFIPCVTICVIPGCCKQPRSIKHFVNSTPVGQLVSLTRAVSPLVNSDRFGIERLGLYADIPVFVSSARRCSSRSTQLVLRNSKFKQQVKIIECHSKLRDLVYSGSAAWRQQPCLIQHPSAPCCIGPITLLMCLLPLSASRWTTTMAILSSSLSRRLRHPVGFEL